MINCRLKQKGLRMKILATNDDGIFAPGLWTLVRELKKTAWVIVVAPDRERSAIGTAVTLRQPLWVQRVEPMVPEVEAYSVEGTPADSVILGLDKLANNKIDLVISGINQGLNLGDDVLISGTVGAALQGYLRGVPALAISVSEANSLYLDNAAKVAALLAKMIDSGALATATFLNVNLPDLPLGKIKGIRITHLASGSHTNTAEEREQGQDKCYCLVRQRTNRGNDKKTDLGAIEQGYISITPLHTALLSRLSPSLSDSLCSGLLLELRRY